VRLCIRYWARFVYLLRLVPLFLLPIGACNVTKYTVIDLSLDRAYGEGWPALAYPGGRHASSQFQALPASRPSSFQQGF
jgi:hypothetical protein